MPKTLTIAGESFNVPAAEDVGYVEGHVCTAAEARSLFQTRCENIGNNLRKTVQEAREKGTDPTQAVDEYARSYNFAMPGAGSSRRVMDPVEREARTQALKAIREKLATDGRKVKDVDPTKLEAAIEYVIEQNDLLAKAKKVVAARAKAGVDTLEGVDLAA